MTVSEEVKLLSGNQYSIVIFSSSKCRRPLCLPPKTLPLPPCGAVGEAYRKSCGGGRWGTVKLLRNVIPSTNDEPVAARATCHPCTAAIVKMFAWYTPVHKQLNLEN